MGHLGEHMPDLIVLWTPLCRFRILRLLCFRMLLCLARACAQVWTSKRARACVCICVYSRVAVVVAANQITGFIWGGQAAVAGTSEDSVASGSLWPQRIRCRSASESLMCPYIVAGCAWTSLVCSSSCPKPADGGVNDTAGGPGAKEPAPRAKVARALGLVAFISNTLNLAGRKELCRTVSTH